MNVHGFNTINNRNNVPVPQESEVRDNISRPNRNNQNYANQQDNGGLPGFEPLTIENVRNAEKHRVLFVAGRHSLKPPRDEHYADMLNNTFCPVIKCFSFTTLLILFDIGMFIASLIIGLNK
jgi:hypothetical protein